MPTRWFLLGPALLLLASMVSTAAAAEWGTIQPGTSTMETVRARFGAATKTTAQKQDGYNVAQWTFEGAGAPPGFVRLTVDFGLLTALGFRADTVRTFSLVPKPGVFNRRAIVNGWGPPTRVGREADTEVFFYDEGLLVYFAKDGWDTQLLVFTLPQTLIVEPEKPKP